MADSPPVKVLGFIGVMAVPVGIPTLSLLLLLKNSAGIRDGKPTVLEYSCMNCGMHRSIYLNIWLARIFIGALCPLQFWSAKCLNWSIVTRAHAPRQVSSRSRRYNPSDSAFFMFVKLYELTNLRTD